MRVGYVSDRSMFANLQTPSQIDMESWLTGITARLQDQDLPGFEAH